jgi:hypothetical protein
VNKKYIPFVVISYDTRKASNMELVENEDKFIITGKVKCKTCKGSGLYKGMCEGGASAVECYGCGGKGFSYIRQEFDKFSERKIISCVRRVYHTAGPYRISDEDWATEDGTLIRFSEAGVSYQDWLRGKEPKPIEDLHCPYMHTGQCLGYKFDVNDLYKTRCDKNLRYGAQISQCKLFHDKAKCWKIYNGHVEGVKNESHV